MISASSSCIDFQDTIAAISWRAIPRTPAQFVCASWDSKVSLFEVDHAPHSNPTIRCKFSRTMEYPCVAIDCQISSDKIIAGSINGDMHLIEGEGQVSTRIGSHEDAVKGVYYMSESCVCSVSYDKTIRLWDARLSGPDIGRINLGAKPACYDFSGRNMVVGLEDGKIGILSWRELSRFFWSKR